LRQRSDWGGGGGGTFFQAGKGVFVWCGAPGVAGRDWFWGVPGAEGFENKTFFQGRLLGFLGDPPTRGGGTANTFTGFFLVSGARGQRKSRAGRNSCAGFVAPVLGAVTKKLGDKGGAIMCCFGPWVLKKFKGPPILPGAPGGDGRVFCCFPGWGGAGMGRLMAMIGVSRGAFLFWGPGCGPLFGLPVFFTPDGFR